MRRETHDRFSRRATVRRGLAPRRPTVCAVRQRLGRSHRTVCPQVAVIARALEKAAFHQRREEGVARRAIQAPHALCLISCQLEAWYFEVFGANELRPIHGGRVVVAVHERSRLATVVPIGTLSSWGAWCAQSKRRGPRSQYGEFCSCADSPDRTPVADALRHGRERTLYVLCGQCAAVDIRRR